MECNNLSALGIHNYPYPLLVPFIADEAKDLIDFRFQCVDEQLSRLGFNLAVEIIGQVLIKVGDKAQ